MTVKVFFFGYLVDHTGQTEMEVNNISDTDALKDHLLKEFPGLVQSRFAIAVNQELTRENVSLKNGDQVALLPPYAGG